MTRRPALPFASWPQGDQRRWSAALTLGAVFDAAGLAAHWAPTTRIQVEEGYGYWLAFLAEVGELDPDSPPRSRLSVPRLDAYIAELRGRLSPVTVATRLRSLAEALRVMQPNGDRGTVLTGLRKLERHAKPQRKSRQPLVAPSDLYDAGLARMARVDATATDGKLIQAVHCGDGLRLAMLVAKPIRLQNLTNTRLGVNLVKRGHIYHWCFAARETKTKQAIDASLPDGLTTFIDRWLESYRPILLREHRNEALWISLKGEPMGRAAIYERVCLVTEEEVGVRINPHAFRAIVATGVAIAQPEDVSITPFLLDHRTERTATEHYNLAESLTASTQYLQRLEARRARTQPPSSRGR